MPDNVDFETISDDQILVQSYDESALENIVI